MSLSKTTLQILALVCIFAGLSGYNFMRAAWTAPSATPPASNVSAPINVGANYQVKPGDLGAIRMRAGAYCDASGLNCFDASEFGGGTSCSIETTYVQVCTDQALTCPTGYVKTGGVPDISVGTSCRSTEHAHAAYCSKINCTAGGAHTYAWSIGSYGTLTGNCGTPPRCGGGACYDNRTVICQNDEGATVADSNCPSPKPVAQRTVTMGPCSGS